MGDGAVPIIVEPPAGLNDNLSAGAFSPHVPTGSFGAYDVDCIVEEPSGWMCLNDKLMLV